MGTMMSRVSIRRPRPRVKFNFNSRRITEIAALIRYRHSEGLPDTDDAIIYLQAIWWHIPVKGADIDFEIENFLIKTGIKFPLDAAQRKLLIKKYTDTLTVDQPKRRDATALGRFLKLTLAERTAAGITTIRPFDVTTKEMRQFAAKRKREADRLRAEKNRRAKGMKIRRVYLANSLSRKQPWNSLKISRRTWERRRRALSKDSRKQRMSQVRRKHSSLLSSLKEATHLRQRSLPNPSHRYGKP